MRGDAPRIAAFLNSHAGEQAVDADEVVDWLSLAASAVWIAERPDGEIAAYA